MQGKHGSRSKKQCIEAQAVKNGEESYQLYYKKRSHSIPFDDVQSHCTSNVCNSYHREEHSFLDNV